VKILAIDTSGKAMGIAIADENGIIIEHNDTSGAKHSTALASTIKNILDKAGLGFNDIDGFTVSMGPGSFTGLRIGVTMVKGFAFATKKPVTAVPTLDTIAYNCIASPRLICTIVDASRNLVYACLYESRGQGLERKSDYLLISVSELLKRIQGPVMFLGDGLSIYREHIIKYFKDTSMGAGMEFAPEPMWYPKASTVAIMGLERFKDGKFENPDKLVPFYIYPTI
jgi:tRNA threonylcarbamoyladenosine biosynthesis protein TsaB